MTIAFSNFFLAESTTMDAWMVGFTGLTALASLGAMVVMIVALNRRQSVQMDRPLEVRTHETFVPRQDFQAHTAHVARDMHELREILRREIPEMERRIGLSVEVRMGKLHDRINDIITGLSRLEGRLNQSVRD